MEIKKTITSIFMVPTLKIDRKKLATNGFINAYSKDVKQEVEYKDAIYILFKPNDLDIFRAFLAEEYERTDQVVEDYDYPDGYVVIIYKLDNKFKKDFELVKLGKYSLTSKKFQEIFPKTVTIIKDRFAKEEISLQYRIFNRTEDLVKFWEERLAVVFDNDQEVWYGFDEEKEVLDIDKIKEYV
jgi:putative IMPACT (imprinted ancient) family translation regulator